MNISVDDAVKKIETEGYCVVSPFYDVNLISQECESVLNAPPSVTKSGYSMGRLARLYSEKSLDHIETSYPALFNFFNQDFLKAIYKRLKVKGNRYLDDIFISSEVYGGDVARNGYLHFDRKWALKFMLYLTDVDDLDGPFSVIPKTHLLGAELRRKQWSLTDCYDDLKNRIEIDYPDLGYGQGSLSKITGRAGTLIMFDSDIFHLGGVVQKKDGFRMLVRGHCRG